MDEIDVTASESTLCYKQNGQVLAVVTMGRDIESLAREVEMKAEAASEKTGLGGIW